LGPLGSATQAGNDFAPDARDVPVEASRQPDGLVQKTMNFFETESFVFENPNDDAP
jgi:hypothetical protein